VSELPSKIDRIQELSVVEAIVVGRIGLGEIGRRYCGHFVAIYRVANKEMLHFICHLCLFKDIIIEKNH
jgi:hypothetical protein